MNEYHGKEELIRYWMIRLDCPQEGAQMCKITKHSLVHVSGSIWLMNFKSNTNEMS